MRKYDRGLHHTMRHELHSLDMTERVHFPDRNHSLSMPQSKTAGDRDTVPKNHQ